MTTEPRAWWYGCWLEAGHFLFDRNGCRIGRTVSSICPIVGMHWIDGGLAPRRVPDGIDLGIMVPQDGVVFSRMRAESYGHSDGIERRSYEADQGEVLLHSIRGCTIAAWWDRTQGDTRPGSNSCFIVEGNCTETEMLDLFPRLFPTQANRLKSAGVVLRILRWGNVH